jgi:hypothetical protein
MAGDALGSVAPVDNLLLYVDDAQASRQAFEDAATDLGIVE